MEKQAEDRFVLFNIDCKCGTKLMVHGEYFVGTRGGTHSVQCPKCSAGHGLPTKPLRFFYEESGYWKPVFV
jgi:hypothetical protein